MTDKNDRYNPAEVEAKWHQKWEETGLYRQEIDWDRPKHYALTMLPYPSGDLHIGHWYAMTPSDARARYMRMQGYNVLFPMGFDAFGLPAENAAIERNIHPKKWTYENIEKMRRQLKSMGAMFDWEREAISSDPSYYHWTEWFFKKLLEQGLAYRKKAAVDFCPNCNTTLAREQVWGEDRHCERCGTPVIKKELAQWFFRTTDYAEELLDFSDIDWPDRVVTMQKNWIGKSVGAEVVFETEDGDPMPVFTTRPDTLWGATFMVLAPEHPLVEKITTDERREEVDEYRARAERMSDIDREAADRPKTGVFTGAYAVNPVNQARIPIWVADYVLMTYGSGAIMAVPAHDERDFAFAQKYGLPIVEVIRSPERLARAEAGEELEPLPEAHTEKEGQMVNSGPFDGTPADVGVEKVTAWLEEEGTGERAVNYKLRDWLISRQRYWGAPIPIIYCDEHGAVPVPDEDLPVVLPDDVEFMPTGESPLKYHEEFRYAECPICGRPSERETDTMDTFMCSSWYQYRYLSPDYDEGPFDPEECDYWMPVDQYTGGIEHATMHLIYTRFFTKAMRDMGLVDFDEPMLSLYNQGMVLGEDGEKMSKSRGNVVAPDDLVEQFGADTVRTYLMFFAKWDQGGPWNYAGIKGPQRFLNDVWDLGHEEYAPAGEDDDATRDLRRKTHQTIRKVGDDMESFSFNTAVAALMELRNAIMDARDGRNVSAAAWDEAVDGLLLLLAPVAPHIAEELWARRGNAYSIHEQPWPEWDEEIAKEETITLVVQVNGRVRAKVDVPAGISNEEAERVALAEENVQRWLDGKTPKKVIVVPNRLVNIVV
ncbi:MAG: leucine--tRNA ligase [Candidatus Promineifilaceae bacterium]|nr:leucine--tRNA ligase [Candidatus Promineifilaceae bacterium]